VREFGKFGGLCKRPGGCVEQVKSGTKQNSPNGCFHCEYSKRTALAR
jgi:hypothetical protein